MTVYEIDLGAEILTAFTMSDLEFKIDDDMPTALHCLQAGENSHEIIGFRVVRGEHVHSCYIGQVLFLDADLEKYDMREVRMFMHEYDIPSFLPVSDNMIGPVPYMMVGSIIKLVQARLQNDRALGDQYIDDIHGAMGRKLPSAARGPVVIPLFG